MNLQPTSDNLVVRKAKENYQEGQYEVVASGPGRLSESGVLVPNMIKPWDSVLVSPGCVAQFFVSDQQEPVLMTRERDVLAKVL